MSNKTIQINNQNGIAILTLDRPKALNAINKQLMGELNDFFSEGYLAVNDLCGVIITGSGEKAFAAGADISEFSYLDLESATALSKFGHDTYFLIERFHVPVIAAVNGYALGGGCELAMACHMRVAGSNARFGQPEVNLGLIPGYGGSQRLIQLIGKGKAMELLLTGDMIGAAEALNLGLVNHVVDPGQELSKANSIIDKIAAKGPNAVTQTINLVNKFFDYNLPAFEMEYKTFGKCMVSDEAKEGASAFLEKRKAEFKR